MVRILANGDIVQDDDPRVQQTSRRQMSGASPQGGFQSAGEPRFQEQAQVRQVNIFQALNQRLRNFGIPAWNIGDITIEPIVSIGLLLSFMLFGVNGLIFGLILFAVSKWSQHGAPNFFPRMFGGGGGNRQNDQDRSQDSGHRGRAGGGYRLGR